MKVKDIMTKNLITCDINNSIHQISQKMKEYDIGFMIITDKKKVEGIITDRDIVIQMISNYDHKVKDYISKNIYTINQGETIDYALDVMKEKKIKRLLVTDKLRVVGVLSLSDILNNTENNKKLIDTIKSIYSIKVNINEQNVEVDTFYL